mgnify:CR=1 FL=1
MKSTNIQNTPLAKLLPSAVAVVVIASLSASATANQISIKSKTPAQVEHALTALLDSRNANLQSASYTGQQSSNSSSSVPKQAHVKKVDYSQKSVAELVLAGLAITSEAKYELSSPTTSKEPKPVDIATDYAVTDILSVEELDAYQNSAPLTADASEFTAPEETASEENNQIASNTNELAEDAIIASLAPVTKELNTEVVIADTGVEETDPIEHEIAEIGAPEITVVELEIAETDATEIAVVELEIAETDATDIAVVALEIAETDAPEIAVVALEIAETDAPEIAVVELEITEADAPEIAVVELEITEADAPEIAVVELEITETEEVASIAILEGQAPVLLASLSAYTQASPDSISDDETVNIAEIPQVITDKLGANVNVAIRSEGCPANFNKVSIPVNGKLCQIFAADFPASMILFIPQTPEEVVQYYLASGSFIEPKKIKKRTMLKSTDNNTTLIISKDGGGTQVDILVKSPVS